MYQSAFKTALGGEMLSLSCWGYQFIQTYSVEIANTYLPSAQISVNVIRNLTNNNYTLLENSLDSQNNTNHSSIFATSLLASKTDSVESVYAVLKDKLRDARPDFCVPETSNDDLDKVLSTSLSLTQSGVLTVWFNDIVSENNKYCANQTNYNKCAKDWLSLLENVSSAKRNSLPEYKEASLPDCGRTLVYKNSKGFEKELRNQLVNAIDAFSILWKSVQIEMYDKCSEKLYNIVKDNPCDLSQFSRSKSLGMILGGNGVLGNCIQSYLRNETSSLSEQLNLTKT